MYQIDGHTGWINDVDFHPTSNIISSASTDKKVFVSKINLP